MVGSTSPALLSAIAMNFSKFTWSSSVNVDYKRKKKINGGSIVEPLYYLLYYGHHLVKIVCLYFRGFT